MRVRSIDLNCLGLGGGVDGVPLDGFRFLDHDGSGHSTDADLTVGVGGIEALTGQMPIIGIDVATVRIGQFKLHASQGFMGHAVELPDDQRSLRLIVETQGLHFASFDLDGLGGSVQHIAFQCLGFPSGHRSARL